MAAQSMAAQILARHSNEPDEALSTSERRETRGISHSSLNGGDLILQRTMSMAFSTGRLGFEEESTDNLLHVKWGAQPFFTRETTEVKNAFEEWLVGDEKSDRLARLERGITRLLRLLFAYCVPNGDTRLVNWALRHRTTAFVLMSALAYILGTMIPAFIISFFTNVYFLPGHLGPFLYMYGRLQCAALMCIPPLLLLDTIKMRGWSGSFRSHLAEFIIHMIFLGLLFTAAQGSFDPGDRFAMRTRVMDMVLDEYFLEGEYLGNLEMAGEIGEVLETLTTIKHTRAMPHTLSLSDRCLHSPLCLYCTDLRLDERTVSEPFHLRDAATRRGGCCRYTVDVLPSRRRIRRRQCDRTAPAPRQADQRHDVELLYLRAVREH